MTQWNRIFKALSLVLPAGAVGASVLLALASSDARAASNQSAAAAQPSDESVSTRLQAIRAGVSDLTGSAGDDIEGAAKATPSWWGNAGWGRVGWGNGGWHNWHNGGWGNGGWGNGGWHNAGWGNGGWGNGGWNNGWHNFWHNW
jgi:hypothetical protein